MTHHEIRSYEIKPGNILDRVAGTEKYENQIKLPTDFLFFIPCIIIILYNNN